MEQVASTANRTASAGVASSLSVIASVPEPLSLWEVLVKFRRIILGFAVIIVLLTLWEVLSRADILRPQFFSSPSRVTVALMNLMQTRIFWEHFTASTGALFLGWVITMAVAIPFGIAMGWYSLVRDTFDFAINAVHALPRIATIPVLMLVMGYGIQYKVAVIMLITFFPLLLNTISGIRSVDSSLTRMSRSFGASDLQLFMTIALPSAIPSILTGVRQAIAMGLVGVTVAEFFASDRGLGYLMTRSSQLFRIDDLYATVVILSVLGVLLTEAVRRVENHFGRWKPEA